MPTNQEHVHLAWLLWSDLRVIPTHGNYGSLVRPLTIFALSCLVDLNPVTCCIIAINARRLPLAPLVFSLVRPLVTEWEMTTTVVNNSLFRSLFEKQKLAGNNFMEWYRNLRIVLSTEDKLPFLEQPIPTLPVPPEGQANLLDVVTTHQA
ncbi:hypothetical protein Tco_0515420 [Tanacetum coccineum]